MPHVSESEDVSGHTLVENLYLQALPGSGQTVEQVAATLLVRPDVFLEQMRPLIELGIVSVEQGVLQVDDPMTATRRALAARADDLARSSLEIARLVDVIPLLGESRGSRLPTDESIDGDISGEGDVPALITSWIGEKRGDLSFLRPDQWRFPSESEMSVAVGNAVREGRRVRAIYPARALTEAPEMLRKRAEIGEEIARGAERVHPDGRGRSPPRDPARAPRGRVGPARGDPSAVDRRDAAGLLRRALGVRDQARGDGRPSWAWTGAGCSSPSSPTASRTSRSPATST